MSINYETTYTTRGKQSSVDKKWRGQVWFDTGKDLARVEAQKDSV